MNWQSFTIGLLTGIIGTFAFVILLGVYSSNTKEDARQAKLEYYRKHIND